MRIIFKKYHEYLGMRLTVGSILTQDDEQAKDWISKGIAEEYKGVYPPKIEHRKPETKRKIHLKDLK